MQIDTHEKSTRQVVHEVFNQLRARANQLEDREVLNRAMETIHDTLPGSCGSLHFRKPNEDGGLVKWFDEVFNGLEGRLMPPETTSVISRAQARRHLQLAREQVIAVARELGSKHCKHDRFGACKDCEQECIDIGEESGFSDGVKWCREHLMDASAIFFRDRQDLVAMSLRDLAQKIEERAAKRAVGVPEGGGL